MRIELKKHMDKLVKDLVLQKEDARKEATGIEIDKLNKK